VTVTALAGCSKNTGEHGGTTPARKNWPGQRVSIHAARSNGFRAET
jgi:hypothetical protein